MRAARAALRSNLRSFSRACISAISNPENMGTSVRELHRKLTELKNSLNGEPHPHT